MSLDTLGYKAEDLLEAVPYYGLWINGHERHATFSHRDQYYGVTNPYTRKHVGYALEAQYSDVEDAVTAARSALNGEWGYMSADERSQRLHAFATLVSVEAENLAKLESQNTGKPFRFALESDLAFIASTLRFYAAAARDARVGGLAAGEYSSEHTSYLRREPVGVVASITPWNYPALMAAWKIGAALSMGNTIILKPSFLTPLSTVMLARLSSHILPRGVLNVLTGRGEVVGHALAMHKGVDMVTFTGGHEAARKVLSASGSNFKRVHLELGGKAPFVVFDDADIELAAKGAAAAAFANMGQDCTQASRILVHESVYSDFMYRFLSHVSNLRPGDPTDPDTTFGPLVSEKHWRSVQRAVTMSTNSPNVEDNRPPIVIPGFGERQFFYPPTIFPSAEDHDLISELEVFGPVVAVSKFSDVWGVIRSSNRSRYGLAASVWTRDLDKAMLCTQHIKAGMVWVNDHLPHTPEMPHAGQGLSGSGRDLSALSLDEFSTVKHVMISLNRANVLKRHELICGKPGHPPLTSNSGGSA